MDVPVNPSHPRASDLMRTTVCDSLALSMASGLGCHEIDKSGLTNSIYRRKAGVTDNHSRC